MRANRFLMPMDLSVNKSVKHFMKSEFEKWYADQISEELKKSRGRQESSSGVISYCHEITRCKMDCESVQLHP
ncbi:hypothetical protein KUTeg_000018, partial [Tegillarca granosa]